jgi:hypothetical protein
MVILTGKSYRALIAYVLPYYHFVHMLSLSLPPFRLEPF